MLGLIFYCDLIPMFVNFIDVFEGLHVVFELLLRNFVDLVYHEYMLLEGTEKLVETRLGWSLG